VFLPLEDLEDYFLDFVSLEKFIFFWKT